MTANEFFHGPLAERIVFTLAHFLWQGSVAAVLVWIGASLVGNDVRRRYLVSTGGLLLLIVCPVATFLTLDVRPPHGGVEGASPAVVVSDGFSRTAETGAEWRAAAAADLGSKGDLLQSFSPWLLAGWLSGVAALSCRLLLGLAFVAWLKRTGEEAGEAVCHRARVLCARLKLRAPAVRLSRNVTQAMAVGFWRPAIILPAAWLAQLPPSCLEAVLAHELAHIRRRDLWVNLLQRVVETLLFYHPAVWWLSARLRQEREMCCDELAVSLTGRRVEYASTLELVARRRRASGAPALAAGIGGRKMALLNRVKNILGMAPAAAGAGPWTVSAAALVAAAVWWAASSGSPLAAWAGDGESLVALAADEGKQGERKEKPEKPRDGEAKKKPKEEHRADAPQPERLRRHVGELEAKVRALKEQGRHEEAERLALEIQHLIKRFEGKPALHESKEAHREAPKGEIPPEARVRLEQLQRQLREAKRDGRADEAERIAREIQAIGERIRAKVRVGEVPPEARERLEQLQRRLREAKHDGRADEAERIAREIHAIQERIGGKIREGEHPRADERRLILKEIPAEAREHLERLHGQLREAKEAGRRDEAERIQGQIQQVHEHLRTHLRDAERHERPHREHAEGDRPVRGDVRAAQPELLQVIRELREEVSRLRREVEELRGERSEKDR